MRRTSCWVRVLRPPVFRQPASCARRPQDAPRVDAAVLVEAAVLDGEDGLRQVSRQIGGCQLGALEHAAGGEGLAVVGSITRALGVGSTLRPPSKGRVAMLYPTIRKSRMPTPPVTIRTWRSRIRRRCSSKPCRSSPGPAAFAAMVGHGSSLSRPDAGLADTIDLLQSGPVHGSAKKGLAFLRMLPTTSRIEGRAFRRSGRGGRKRAQLENVPGRVDLCPGCPLLSPSSPPVSASYCSICHNPG